MTLTRAPSGVFRITPDDGSVDVLEIGRAPDFADVDDRDLGQTVGRTDGTAVFVYGKAVETRTYAYTFRGLTTHEFWWLYLYLRDTLKASQEVATVEWGRARNRVLYSTTAAARNSEDFAGWQAFGSVSAADGTLVGPEGVANTASEVTFGPGGPGTQVLRCPGVLEDFGTGVGHVRASALMKVTDAGGSIDFRFDSTAPGLFDATIPDDGEWHLAEGVYSGMAGTDFDIQNLSDLSGGARTVGIAHVQVLWGPSRPPPKGFFDPAPLKSIPNARYVPGTFRGRERQNGLWDASVTFRREIP